METWGLGGIHHAPGTVLSPCWWAGERKHDLEPLSVVPLPSAPSGLVRNADSQALPLNC